MKPSHPNAQQMFDWEVARPRILSVIARAFVLQGEPHLPPIDLAKDSLRRELVKAALGCTQGNITRAARILGLNRTTLVEMLKIDERKQRESRSAVLPLSESADLPVGSLGDQATERGPEVIDGRGAPVAEETGAGESRG